MAPAHLSLLSLYYGSIGKASLLCFVQAKVIPATGPLHLQLLLPGTLRYLHGTFITSRSQLKCHLCRESSLAILHPHQAPSAHPALLTPPSPMWHCLLFSFVWRQSWCTRRKTRPCLLMSAQHPEQCPRHIVDAP